MVGLHLFFDHTTWCSSLKRKLVRRYQRLVTKRLTFWLGREEALRVCHHLSPMNEAVFETLCGELQLQIKEFRERERIRKEKQAEEEGRADYSWLIDQQSMESNAGIDKQFAIDLRQYSNNICGDDVCSIIYEFRDLIEHQTSESGVYSCLRFLLEKCTAPSIEFSNPCEPSRSRSYVGLKMKNAGETRSSSLPMLRDMIRKNNTKVHPFPDV